MRSIYAVILGILIGIVFIVATGIFELREIVNINHKTQMKQIQKSIDKDTEFINKLNEVLRRK